MPRKKTLVEIEKQSLKKYKKEIKDINQEYRKEVFYVLARSLNHIRHVAADKYIIKNLVGKRMSPWKMAKLQPSHPSKLTERTGRLIEMMKHDKKWHGIKDTLLQTTATAAQQTMGLKGRILAVKEGRNVLEKYEATLRANIASSNPFLGKGFVGGGRIIDVINGKPIRLTGRKETKQTLQARFLHEKGVRGHVREAFAPAADDEDIRMKQLFDKRLSRILRVRARYGST